MNISGGGMLKNAPHKEAAIKFLEYLASDEAQAYFANGNNEWPVVPGVKVDNPELTAAGHLQGRHDQRGAARQEPAGSAEDRRPREVQVAIALRQRFPVAPGGARANARLTPGGCAGLRAK